MIDAIKTFAVGVTVEGFLSGWIMAWLVFWAINNIR